MNVAAWLISNPHSERLALIDGQQRLTHAALARRCRAVREALADAGVKPGDRVLILEENSPFWVASYLGAIGIGAVAVPVSPTAPAEHLASIISATQPAAMCLKQRTAQRLGGALPEDITYIGPEAIDAAVGSGADDENQYLFDPPDPRQALAAIMYTSGSTGTPRGVMVSHANIRANTESILDYLELTSDDRMMVVLPFYYCFGTSLLHTHLRAGASLVLNNRFMFPDKVLRQVQQESCTGLAGVPSTFQILLRKSSLSTMELPTLRHIQQAGGKLAASFLDELSATVPQARIFVMYGQTEATARLSYLPPELLDTKRGSIGRGIAGATLQVVDDRGQPVPPGEVGEIVASGENITLGYWNEPEATAETFRDGKLYTGDLATVDAEGFITIVDRAKDFLKCAGYRVAARQIEEVLLEFPGVVEAAVVGVPDELQGEAVRAFIVHASGDAAVKDALHRHCVVRLKPYLLPREVVFLDALPKNSAGKVLKSQLREIHA